MKKIFFMSLLSTFAVSYAYAEETKEELTIRCIQSALDQGYVNGQCAFSYIDVCVTTQNKSKMLQSLNVDNMLGMLHGTYCPNMPKTYVPQFNKIRDKF